MHRIDAMQIFTRVADLASFTQAAESLGLPKASVSQAVQQLESTLGTRLLHRTTRKVQLTQDGQSFYERCLDVLADVDELSTMFQQGAEALRGRVRIDMSSGIARHIVIPRLPEFLAAHPQLEIELSSTDRRVDLVREGFDCVVRVGTLSDSGLIARPLGIFSLINLASPAYLAAFGTPESLDDLAKHRLVHYVSTFGAKSTGFEYVDAEDTDRRIAMKGAMTVNNAEAYQAACLAGLGIVQAPHAGVTPLLSEGRLVEVLPQFRARPMPVSLLYANRRHQPKRVQVVMKWLGECIEASLRENAA
jgi:DNA-binding transcriptional LysR family regulator